MKLRHIGQMALAGAVSLGIVVGIGACTQDNTIDYVYVTNAKNSPGQIDIYLVDHLSGTLTPLKSSPVSSGGQNPQSIAATANGNFLYVANHDDNSIVEFAVGGDATLTQKNVYQTPGNSPTSLTIDSTGTYLFVTDAFQPQYSASNPGPGALVIYPIKSDGTLGTPLTDATNGTPYYATCNNPVAVSVLNNSPILSAAANTPSSFAVYVVDDPASQPPKIAETIASVGSNGSSTVPYTASGSCTATTGQITAYTLNYTNSGGSSGSISLASVVPVAGSPFAAGTAPDAIITDIQNQFVYVTDLVTNQLLAYVITGAGVITPLNNGPFSTGVYPDAITIDPTNQYIYVANFKGSGGGGSGTISGYQINHAGTGTTGVPSGLSSGTFATKTGPTFVYIEPSSGRYLYTSNFVDNTVSGLNLNINTGALSAVQNSPFPAAGEPTSMTAVTHGSHSIQVLPIY
jgi:6-phosphogluconolactonase (cycloisomerase 2 family)